MQDCLIQSLASSYCVLSSQGETAPRVCELRTLDSHQGPVWEPHNQPLIRQVAFVLDELEFSLEKNFKQQNRLTEMPTFIINGLEQWLDLSNIFHIYCLVPLRRL